MRLKINTTWTQIELKLENNPKLIFIMIFSLSWLNSLSFLSSDTLPFQIGFAAMQRSFLYISMSISFSNYPYSKHSFLAKIVLKLFSILSLWTRKVDLQSFTKEWKNWQKCKLDFHVRNAQYKDLPYCFSTLYSKKQWPMKLSNYYCSNLSLLPFWRKDH